MTEFAHSIVLFSGDDGCPLEFNIQNTVEKEKLKDMIEYGGGLCTLSDDAIHLVSPGTKVLNVDPSKKLISSKYIYDCVNQNYLLDTDEYRIEINVMETSDFSDNSANLIENQPNREVDRKSSDDDDDNSIDILESDKPLSPNLVCPPSNHAFDFESSESRSNIAVNKQTVPSDSRSEIPLKLPDNFSSLKFPVHISVSDEAKKIPAACNNVLPDSLEDPDESVNMGQNLSADEVPNVEANINSANNENMDVVSNGRDSPIGAVVVSSSQPNEGVLDQFDNIVLNKINEKPAEVDKNDEESLSQSNTISSSADAAQISPKQPSRHTSAEIFEGSSVAPDSASQTTERQQYIKNLESEIEQILQKPSPKSIQDKITLVKYICCVKKLAPAVVLQTLQNF